MDYSNVQGYWKAVVDSEGVKKRSLEELVDRFYSSKQDDWFDKFNSLDTSGSSELNDLTKTKLRRLVFFESQMCTTNGGETSQGIAATMDGVLDVGFYYEFSLIATWDPTSKVEVPQAAGFWRSIGTTSATFTVAGINTLDTSQKLSGKSLSKSTRTQSIGCHSLFKGWASFVPYKQESVRLKSTGESSTDVTFNGYMEVKAQV
ncbi:hypothetical protein E8E12_007898 [Didymella heteroderae]|uniref:Uncharacterized protein n=1 Tax=Didymella heteroderae TaxID=1769908 RepID=A0A9P5C1Y0_9PLEO|nr:hypothetical protein E8E12_007898 [Didymella heteroderae]